MRLGYSNASVDKPRQGRTTKIHIYALIVIVGVSQCDVSLG